MWFKCTCYQVQVCALHRTMASAPARAQRRASTQLYTRKAQRQGAVPHSFSPSAPSAPHSPGQRLDQDSASGPPPGQYPENDGVSSHQDPGGYQPASPDAQARAATATTAGGVRQANKVTAAAGAGAGASAAQGMSTVSQAYAAQEQAARMADVRPFEVTSYADSYSNVITMTGRLGQDPHMVRFEERQLAKLSLAFRQSNNTDSWCVPSVYMRMAALRCKRTARACRACHVVSLPKVKVA